MAENNPTLLLFDVSPFLYIGYWGAVFMLKDRPSISDEGKVTSVATNIIVGKIKNIMQGFEDKPIIPVFIYDGFPQRKLDILKSYKDDRTKRITKEVKKALISTVKLFPGFHVINKDEEADDLIATILKIYRSSQYFYYINAFIYTRDNDLMQLSNYKTFVVDPAKDGKLKDREYLSQKFDGITNFKHVILHKICFGDPSDNITGIFKGRRRKPIIEQFQTCSKFSEFLNLDIVQERKKQAIDLFNLIKLRDNLEYDEVFNADQSMLDFDMNILKPEKL